MIVDGIYTLLIPAFRSLAGFGIAVFLGILGGWLAITFNHMIGFPWSLELHRNIYIVGIGLGSGLGAYFAWVNLSIPWYFVLLTICVVLIGGVASAFGGMVYGSFVEQSYLGRAYTIDNNLHWGAAVGGIFVATCVGLFNQLVTQRRVVG